MAHTLRKTTSTFLVFVLVLVLVLVCARPTTASDEPVLDTDGNPLRSGEFYYIERPRWFGSGGLILQSIPDRQPCPHYITQSQNEVDPGTPVQFVPQRDSIPPPDQNINLNTDYNVAFSRNKSNPCNNWVWRVNMDTLTPDDPQVYVTNMGSIGYPGPGTLSNWFKIVKANPHAKENHEYKLRYCPTVAGPPPDTCADLGFVSDNNRNGWWLALYHGAHPLTVQFRKATRSTTEHIIKLAHE